MATLKNTTINTTSHFVLPTATPASPQAGMIRQNSTTNQIEYYADGRWNNVSEPDSIGGLVSTVDVGSNTFNIHTFSEGTSTFTRN